MQRHAADALELLKTHEHIPVVDRQTGVELSKNDGPPRNDLLAYLEAHPMAHVAIPSGPLQPARAADKAPPTKVVPPQDPRTVTRAGIRDHLLTR